MKKDTLLHPERAVSDVVGTVLLLGVTVTLLAAVAAGLNGALQDVEDTPRVDVRLRATAGAESVTLTHAGGPTLPRDGVRVQVAVNHDVRHESVPGPAGATWRLGEPLTVPLDAPLAPGDRVHASVHIASAGGGLAGEAVTRVTTAAAPPALEGNFTVRVVFASGTDVTELQPGADLFVSAAVEHPLGRKSVRAVTANLSDLNGPTAFALHDDGSGGDAVARDGVYSAYYFSTTSLSIGERSLTVRAVDQNGRAAVGAGVVHVQGDVQEYNTAMFHAVGHLLVASNGTQKSDEITVFLKVQVDDPVFINTTEDTTEYTIQEARLLYRPLKPGDTGDVAMSHECSNEEDPMAVVFTVQNITIPWFDHIRDPFRYTFEVRWKERGGAKMFTESITLEGGDAFTLEPEEDVKEVKEHGWPDTFTDCTV